MRKLLQQLIHDRQIVLFVAVLVLLSGLYGYHMMPRQETPAINAPVAVITCTYPGASPSDVDRLVTKKIEDEVKEVEGLDFYQSTAMDSASVTMMILEVSADLDKSFASLREKMDDIQGDLPQECGAISVNTDWFDTTGMMISISGDNYSYEELTQYAEQVKKQLSKLSGIEKTEVVGEQDKEIQIEVDAEKLSFYHLSLKDILQIITLQNTEIPSGKLDGTTGKISVKTKGTMESLKELEDIILDVSASDGSVLRLKDLATLHLQLQDSAQRIRHNGSNAVLITGYFKESQNVVNIGNSVRSEIDSLKSQLPDDLVFSEILYQPETVKNSVNGFVLNLLQGIAFVMAVVFFGMGFRNALVVSLSIPASVIATFSVMWITGGEIHQISVAALIISLGMLVDNAIVVSDAIQVRIDNGEEKLKACIEGAAEVAMPVLTSTLTTMAVFLPLLFLDSMAGKFIRSIPVVVMVSLSVSYVVALTITPILAYLFFVHGKNEKKQDVVRLLYNQAIRWSFAHKGLIAMLLGVVLSAAFFISAQLGLEFFPKADTNLIYINLSNDSDTDLSQTEALSDQVAKVLDSYPEISEWTVSIGDGLPKFYYTLPIASPAKDFAQFAVQLDLQAGQRFNKNSALVDSLQNELDQTLTGGKATVKELEQGEPLGAPVRLKISGTDSDALRAAAEVVRRELASIPGTSNIEDDMDDQVYEYYVDVDLQKASYFGISKYDVQNEVSIALYGRKATVFRGADAENDVIVKSTIRTYESLENLMIKSSFMDRKVLLKDIASIRLQSKSPTIRKYNGEMTVNISSQVKSGANSVVIQSQLKDKLSSMDLGPVTTAFDGEEQSIDEEFGNIGSSAVLALFLIYFILLLEFESFLQPVIIFLTIPLSAVGSILGLYLFRQPLSFTALLGLVSLFGIVVNNAIILIDYINLEVANGKTLTIACLDAVEKRFRPIMLTTLTTVTGLVPMILSRTALFTPMAISLMSGLLLSTLLTLIVIPLAYHSVMKRAPAKARAH